MRRGTVLRRLGLLGALVWLCACGDDAAPADASTSDAPGLDAASDAGGDARLDAAPSDAAVDAPALRVFDEAVSVAVGQAHVCALRRDGSVWCWGGNQAGQLGDGSFVSRSEPAPVIELGPVVALDAGDYHTCVLTEAAERACWGFNAFGQVTRGDVDQPAPVIRGVDRRAVTAGARHTCEITSRDAVRCSGDNTSGQLGNGTTTSSDRGVTVVGLRDALSVSAGESHTCAVRTGGLLSCWGFNGSGQLGTGDAFNWLEPALVSLEDVAAVSAAANHTCALRGDGSVWCWGVNRLGQLGRGTAGGQFLQPEAIAAAGEFVELATGSEHSCARRGDGTVLCWGRGREGQIGDGGGEARVGAPTETGVDDATALAAGGHTTCVVRGAAGEVWCWGANTYGQIHPDRENRLLPAPIAAPESP